MPYIQPHLRLPLERGCIQPKTPGELNYAVTALVDGYIQRSGVSYTTLNAAIGVLECAKLELYRRLAAPYEDRKLAENGDAYRSIS